MKHQENPKLGICFHYDNVKKNKAFNLKRKKVEVLGNPHVLKHVKTPILKKATTKFDEESLLIKKLVANKEESQPSQSKKEAEIKVKTKFTPIVTQYVTPSKKKNYKC